MAYVKIVGRQKVGELKRFYVRTGASFLKYNTRLRCFLCERIV